MEPMLRRLVLDKIAIQVTSTQPLIHVRADETAVNQIMLNLVVNARDAMPDGGTAAVRIDVVVLADPLAPTLGVMAGRHAALSVSDTGHGISADVQRHLFEPFFTTKGADQGTGLGLSIVYGIVKGLSGAIEVQSEVGRGTTFTIYIPLVGDALIAEPSR
jgi:signal transduction histidine kinase